MPPADRIWHRLYVARLHLGRGLHGSGPLLPHERNRLLGRQVLRHDQDARDYETGPPVAGVAMYRDLLSEEARAGNKHHLFSVELIRFDQYL